MVSAAATARSPQRIRKRHPASRVAEAPAGVIRSRTWTGSGSSGVAGPWAVRRDGVRASRTAVGEPSAVRTVRRAGAGAGGTCSGMVGRLSFDRHGGARAGADGAVSSRRSERRGSGSGATGVRPAARHLTTGPRTAGANSLPCSRSLYDACSDGVSSSRFRYRARRYSVGDTWDSSRFCGSHLGDLGIRSPERSADSRRRFSRVRSDVETADCAMPGECAAGHVASA